MSVREGRAAPALAAAALDTVATGDMNLGDLRHPGRGDAPPSAGTASRKDVAAPQAEPRAESWLSELQTPRTRAA